MNETAAAPPGRVGSALDFLDRHRWLPFGLILVLAAPAYWLHVPVNWFPWDDGALAQMAERAARGELAHVDFRDPYTGLLNYWHALGLKWLGRDFLSLRVQLVAAFVMAVALVFALLRRIAGSLTAALWLLIAVFWGPVQYAAPMPSWYNLILAMAMIFFLYRYAEGRSAPWLFVAGVAGGLSMDIKIVGLYAVTAGFFFLVWDTQSRVPDRGETPPSSVYRGLLAALAFAFLAALAWLLAKVPSLSALTWLWLPNAVLASALVLAAAKTPGAADLGSLLRVLAPYALGVALPVAALVLVYAADGELRTLISAVFELPMRRLVHDTTAGPLPDLWTASLGIIVCGLAFAMAHRMMSVRKGLLVLVPILAAPLLLAGRLDALYVQPLGWLRLMPLFAAVVAAPIVSRGRDRPPSETERLLVLLAWFASLLQIIQVPFPHGTYVLYFAPVAFAGMLVGLRHLGRLAELAVAVSLFFFLFGQSWLLHSNPRSFGMAYSPAGAAVPLDLNGAGLFVRPGQAKVYQALVTEVARGGGPGRVYAGPDCPEVPFLLHADYWHPAIYDLYEPDYPDHARFEEHLSHAIVAGGADTVILNMYPAFSRPPSESLLRLLQPHFQRWVSVGNWFLVGSHRIGTTP